MPTHANVLGADRRPSFFRIANTNELGLTPPPERHGQSVRTWARGLAGMQKEALVVNGATGRAWRLVSDEGSYLAGYDEAPCPLAFLTTGMVSSYTTEILALAAQRSIFVRDIRLTLDNYYEMHGSARGGTMTGSAHQPELHVEIDAEAARPDSQRLVAQGVDAAPINGLLRGSHPSRFTLVHNGRRLPTRRVAPLDRDPERDPGPGFLRAASADAYRSLDPIERLVEPDAAVLAGQVNLGIRDRLEQQLHVRGICTVGADGLKSIEQHLFAPRGSSYRFLCDEAPVFGGGGLVPDAVTYASAAVAFCFMTQFGRYAEVMGKDLREYRMVQDTYFSKGGASARTGRAALASPVETHVHVETDEDDEFAQALLDMGEQTCFVHAFCRTHLKTKVRITEGVRG